MESPEENNTGFEVLLSGTKFPAWPLAGHVTSGPSALLRAVGPVRGGQAFHPGKACTKQEVSTQYHLPPSAPLSTNVCREVTTQPHADYANESRGSTAEKTAFLLLRQKQQSHVSLRAVAPAPCARPSPSPPSVL